MNKEIVLSEFQKCLYWDVSHGHGSVRHVGTLSDKRVQVKSPTSPRRTVVANLDRRIIQSHKLCGKSRRADTEAQKRRPSKENQIKIHNLIQPRVSSMWFTVICLYVLIMITYDHGAEVGYALDSSWQKMVVSALANTLFVVVPVMYLRGEGSHVFSLGQHSPRDCRYIPHQVRQKYRIPIGYADFPFEYGTERKRKFKSITFGQSAPWTWLAGCILPYSAEEGHGKEIWQLCRL